MPEKTTSPGVGNLPISASPAFTGDDIALILGTCSPDAVFMLDEESRTLVAGNMKFLSLIDLSLEVLESQDFSFDRVIHPSDRAVFDAWQRAARQGEEGPFGMRLLRTDSSVVSVSIQMKYLRWKRRSYLVAFVHDVSAQETRIAQLKQQVDAQKERAFEAIKSSLRLYQLNEKIKRAPRLAKSLLNVEEDAQLFTETAQILTSEEGLNYKGATFLLVEGNTLKVVYSTQSDMRELSFSLGDDNRYARFIRQGFEQEGEAGEGTIVALQSRGQFLGVFEVTEHTKEKQFFEESSMVREWQEDVLHDIGGILALSIDNLRLTREIKRQAVVDSLTQTYNRHYFVGRLASEVRRASRYSRPTAVIFLDVDSFKQINDRHGHLQGDQVLRDLGQLFRRSLRDVDVVCRYGGDEFVVLLPETELEMARVTAEKLRATVEAHPFPNLDSPDVPLRVTVSVGVSALDTDLSEDDLIHRADSALYRAKKAGRNRVAVVQDPAGLPATDLA